MQTNLQLMHTHTQFMWLHSAFETLDLPGVEKNMNTQIIHSIN